MDEEKVLEFSPGDILPVMIIVNNNSEVMRLVGEKTEEEITLAIDKYK